MKYFIEFGVRALGVQLIELTEEEKNVLLEEENLNDVYYDWVEKCDYNFELEGYYLTPTSDRYTLIIRDENNNIVYESEDVEELEDKTYYDNGEKQVKGWNFKGVKDGYYLTRFQTIKGCYYTGEFELETSFDKNKLYVIQDEFINDELTGDYTFPMCTIYYQNGDGYDMLRDKIDLDFESDYGEQYWETRLLKVEQYDYWIDLRKKE